MRGMDRMVFSSIVFWLGLVLIPVAVLIPDVLVTVYVPPRRCAAAARAGRGAAPAPRLAADRRVAVQLGPHGGRRQPARGRAGGRAAAAHTVHGLVHATGRAAPAPPGGAGSQGAPAPGATSGRPARALRAARVRRPARPRALLVVAGRAPDSRPPFVRVQPVSAPPRLRRAPARRRPAPRHILRKLVTLAPSDFLNVLAPLRSTDCRPRVAPRYGIFLCFIFIFSRNVRNHRTSAMLQSNSFN